MMEPINKEETKKASIKEFGPAGTLIENKEEKAMRFNENKPKWHLLDLKSLTPLVRVLEYGATKYEPFNWKKEMTREDVLDSMMRHMVELNSDNEIDEESKQHHIGHIMANCMFYSFHFMK